MNWLGAVLFAIAAATLAGCGVSASDVEFSPQRSYSADIDAALNHGPTASQPGQSAREEPIGAIPWHSDDRDPNGS